MNQSLRQDLQYLFPAWLAIAVVPNARGKGVGSAQSCNVQHRKPRKQFVEIVSMRDLTCFDWPVEMGAQQSGQAWPLHHLHGGAKPPLKGVAMDNLRPEFKIGRWGLESPAHKWLATV